MLEIQVSGGSSVKISTKSDSLWVDPSTRRSSDKSSELKNAVQIATMPNLLQEPVGERPQLEGPGEYEVGPFALIGFASQHYRDEQKVTSYRLEVAGVAIGVVANGSTDLSEDQLEALGILDMLFISVADGVVGPSPHEAAQLVRRIEPKMVWPIGVAVEDTAQEPASEALAGFAKELGANVETTSQLKIKSLGDIPASLTVYLPA